MRIVNPVFGTPPVGAVTDSAPDTRDQSSSSADWHSAPMLIFGNNKPNAKEILQGIAARVSAVRNGAPVDYMFKSSPSQGASASMLDSIGSRYKIALLALAD